MESGTGLTFRFGPTGTDGVRLAGCPVQRVRPAEGLRTTRADPAAVVNPAAWLTTLVGRVCIDMLRARQARREQLSAT
jgi:hypothetical protein